MQKLQDLQEPQERTEYAGCVGQVGLVDQVDYEVPELAVVGDFAELTLGLAGWHHDAYGGHFRHD